MIKVKVIGGLGNQLFQYAAARSLSLKHGTETVLDISAFATYDVHPFNLNRFNCKGNFVTKSSVLQQIANIGFFRQILIRFGLLNKYYFENGLAFDENIHSLQNGTILHGYFQSEKNFFEIRSQLLQELVVKRKFNKSEQKTSSLIVDANSVAIHVRRGDYILNPEANSVHGICDSSYFERALEYLKEHGCLDSNTNLFIFSDDISWCRDNLDFGYDTIFVEGSAERPEVDMSLISQCKHQIISNSTFSWWGAWLNTNPDKCVIAPLKWFKTLHDSTDIIPDQWKRL